MADYDFAPIAAQPPQPAVPLPAPQHYYQQPAQSAPQQSFLQQKLAGFLTTRNIIILVIVIVVIYFLYRQSKGTMTSRAKKEIDEEAQEAAKDADALIAKLETTGAIV